MKKLDLLKSKISSIISKKSLPLLEIRNLILIHNELKNYKVSTFMSTNCYNVLKELNFKLKEKR